MLKSTCFCLVVTTSTGPYEETMNKMITAYFKVKLELGSYLGRGHVNELMGC